MHLYQKTQTRIRTLQCRSVLSTFLDLLNAFGERGPCLGSDVKQRVCWVSQRLSSRNRPADSNLQAAVISAYPDFSVGTLRFSSIPVHLCPIRLSSELKLPPVLGHILKLRTQPSSRVTKPCSRHLVSSGVHLSRRHGDGDCALFSLLKTAK